MIKKVISVIVALAVTGATMFIPVSDGRYAATAVTIALSILILGMFVFKKDCLIGRLLSGD